MMEDETPEQPEAASNQTVFGKEEPLFERTTVPAQPGVTEVKKLPLWKQKKFLIPAVLVVVLVVFSAMALMTPHHGTVQKRTQQPIATPLHPQETAMQQHLDQLNTELQNADPSKIDLPYPPIQTNISINQSQN